MSILVLKGHETRTKDLLAVLKSLGDLDGLSRIYPQCYYYVSNGKIMVASDLIEGEWTLFTLEKFEEKYPYKVGDKVMYQRELHFVKRMEWNGEEIRYKIDYGDGYSLTNIKVEELEPYKEKEETMEKNEHLILDCILTDKGHELVPYEGYEIKQEGDKYYLVKKKPQYPKTYHECCEVLGMQSNLYLSLSSQDIDGEVEENSYGYKMVYQMNCLYELLVCRDAYWKMAGDWSFENGSVSRDVVYAITVHGSGIMKNFYYALNCNNILVFPTEEMRDSFYNNFYDLINKCKELI